MTTTAARRVTIRKRSKDRCPTCGKAFGGWRPNVPISIGCALEFRRENAEWTQRRMASALGIGASHYSEIVAGKRALPMAATVRAFLLGIPAAHLLNPENRRVKK